MEEGEVGDKNKDMEKSEVLEKVGDGGGLKRRILRKWTSGEGGH